MNDETKPTGEQPAKQRQFRLDEPNLDTDAVLGPIDEDEEEKNK